MMKKAACAMWETVLLGDVTDREESSRENMESVADRRCNISRDVRRYTNDTRERSGKCGSC